MRSGNCLPPCKNKRQGKGAARRGLRRNDRNRYHDVQQHAAQTDQKPTQTEQKPAQNIPVQKPQAETQVKNQEPSDISVQGYLGSNVDAKIYDPDSKEIDQISCRDLSINIHVIFQCITFVVVALLRTLMNYQRISVPTIAGTIRKNARLIGRRLLARRSTRKSNNFSQQAKFQVLAIFFRLIDALIYSYVFCQMMIILLHFLKLNEIQPTQLNLNRAPSLAFLATLNSVSSRTYNLQHLCKRIFVFFVSFFRYWATSGINIYVCTREVFFDDDEPGNCQKLPIQKQPGPATLVLKNVKDLTAVS